MWALKVSSLLILGWMVGFSTQDNKEVFEINSNNTDMSFVQCGEKRFYIGSSFMANFFKAAEYCRFRGMQLATIDNRAEDTCLENHIDRSGLEKSHFWLGGSDLGEEGTFVWLSTGYPVKYTNWYNNEPNNRCWETNLCEHCLGLWYMESKGRKWNDFLCTRKLFFVCEKPYLY